MRAQVKYLAITCLSASLICPSAAGAAGFSLQGALNAIHLTQVAEASPPAADEATIPAPKSATPAKVAAPAPVSPPASVVDDGALRYYALHHQLDRVKLELERLQQLHPGYVQPKDLFQPVADSGSPEDQPLWDLFGADKLQELHTQIASHKALDPSWNPPSLLLKRLAQKEARQKVMSYYADGKWTKLLSLARSDPSLIDTSDLELMWTLAESYAKAQQLDHALAVYQNILKTEKAPQKRLATLQKAMGNLPMTSVEALYAMGHKTDKGGNEFDSIKNELTRARIAAYLHSARDQDVDPADLAEYAAYVKKEIDPSQMALIGWYDYKKKDFTSALIWFKLAIANKGDSIVAHGLALTLAQLGKTRDAEEVAYAWSRFDPTNAILYIDLLGNDLTKSIPSYIDTEQLARYAQVTSSSASGTGAQGLAWYAYNSCQYPVALEWFQRAAAWYPKEATIKGLALTYLRLGDRAHFIETVNRYDGMFPSVVGLVFPSDHYTTPPPCEQAAEAPMAAFDASAFTAQSPAMPVNPQSISEPTLAYPVGMAPNYPNTIHDPLHRYTWGIVPSPTGAPPRILEANYHGEAWQQPLFDAQILPTMVDPQNPLRVMPTAQPMPGTIPANSYPPALVSAFAPEPFKGPWPLLTRRVFGAAAMPYQNNGYVLMKVREPDRAHKGETQEVLRFVPPKATVNPYAPVDNPGDNLPLLTPQQSGLQSGLPATTQPLAAQPSAAQPALVQPALVQPALGQKVSYGLPTSALVEPVQQTEQPRAAVAAPAPKAAAAPSEEKPRARRKFERKPRRKVAAGSQNCGAGNALAEGWCLYNQQRPQEASIAFGRAAAAGGRNGSEAAFGKALASLQSGLLGTAIEIANSGVLTRKQQFDIQTGVLGMQATNSYKQAHYRQCLAYLDQRRALTPETRDLSIIRGWSYFNLVRLDEAKRLFEALDHQMSTPESQRGLGEVNNRLGSGTH
ncbi:MAG: hypothetical protein KGQ46_13665 [Hyphomicrobiales bacterium]|nr:hypothetical protein [Hyphomicrobiales bacterium]MDE2114267.1 hypothetical protein [Hyphomicrobiales bacterium]